MKDNFVNLHLHSLYSIQDSVIKIPDLFETIKQYGQKAVAITDHGTVEGWSDFFLTSQSYDIKPIFGCEFYCKETYMKPSNTNRYHLVILAKNDNGLKTINKMQFESSIKHFYYRPLLPYPFLFENANDNIFISTACALGTVGQSLNEENKNQHFEDAENFLNQLLDTFGRDNIALEFQFHPTWESNKIPDYYPQNDINEKMLDLWDMFDLKYCIATTDAHFINNPDVRKELLADAWCKQIDDIEDSLKSNCVGTSTIVKELAIESGFSDLKLVDTMINNTSIIADQCNVTTVNNIGGKRIIPKFTKHNEFKKIFCKKPKKVI